MGLLVGVDRLLICIFGHLIRVESMLISMGYLAMVNRRQIFTFGHLVSFGKVLGRIWGHKVRIIRMMR